jgi:Double-stranded RNA binding motif.
MSASSAVAEPSARRDPVGRALLNPVTLLSWWVLGHYGEPAVGQKLLRWEFAQAEWQDATTESSRGPHFQATVEILPSGHACSGYWQPNKKEAQRSCADRTLRELQRTRSPVVPSGAVTNAPAAPSAEMIGFFCNGSLHLGR